MIHLWLIIASIFSATQANAAELTEKNRVVVAPYFWAINIDAELGVGSLSLPINLGTAELFSDVNWGALGYAQWNFDKSFVFANAIVVDFDAGEFQPVFNQALIVDFKLLEVGYGQHFRLRRDSGIFRQLVLSPHIGLLHGSLDAQVSGSLNIPIRQQWTGPMLGLMATGPISNRISYILRAQYSDFSNELEDYITALVGVNYQVNENIGVSAAYRIMHSNYQNDGMVINTNFKGGLVGLQFSW